jgi:hypothetical protein
MIIIFVVLLLGVVFVIAFNERVNLFFSWKRRARMLLFFQVAMTARKELLENIRHYPGDEGSDENNFRKTMNSIQKRVKFFLNLISKNSIYSFLASLLWY